MHSLKINKYYDAYHWRQSLLQYAKYVRQLDLIKNYLSKDQILLDFGCGDGKMTSLLSKFVKKIYGVDNQSKPLHFAKALVKQENVLFKQNKSINLPFKKEFDVVTSFDVIEHIHPNKVSIYLAEINRVLKKEGILVLSTPNRNSLNNLIFGHKLADKHYQEFTLSELQELILKHNYCIISNYGIFLQPIFKFETLGCYRPIFKLMKFFIIIGKYFPSLSEKIIMVVKKC